MATIARAVHAETSRAWRVAPSLPDVVFVAVAATTALKLRGLLFWGDSDLGRHLRVGSDVLSGGLFFQDRYSHTRAGAPFVPFEWGSEVLFAGAHRLAGLPGVVLLTAVVLAAAHALVALFLLRRGATPAVAGAGALASVAVGWVHWAARPHIFTLLGVALLLFILESERFRPVAVAALFVLWANLHGGFLFGLILVGLYAAGSAVEGDRAAARRFGLTLLVAAAACLLNPGGPRLFLHVLAWFREGAVMDGTVEYLSPDFHTIGPRPFLVVLLGSMILLARSGRPMPARRLAAVLVATAFALMARRNIALFAVSALPLLALQLPTRPGYLSRALGRGEDLSRTGPWAAAFVGVLLLLGLPRPDGTPGWIRADFDRERFPVDAVAAARDAGLTGRLFNDMDWGGYVLWAWPEQKVFIDGQTDFYGSTVFREHQAVMLLQPGWQDVLDRAGVSLILVPPRWRVVDAALGTGRWRLWYEDETAAVLARRGTGGGT